MAALLEIRSYSMNHLSRRFSTIAVMLLVTTLAAFAAVPLMLNYQGRLTDRDTGEPVPDGTHAAIFTIYDAASSGNILWADTQDVTTRNGLFSTMLGSEHPIPSTTFDQPDRYLEIEVNGEVMNERTQIVSVAYSYNADKLDGYDAADLISGTPSSSFRCYAMASNQSGIEVCNSETFTREVTGIWASSGTDAGGSNVTLYINSEPIITFWLYSYMPSAFWYRADGAGIIIPSGSSVTMDANGNNLAVTITGFTY